MDSSQQLPQKYGDRNRPLHRQFRADDAGGSAGIHGGCGADVADASFCAGWRQPDHSGKYDSGSAEQNPEEGDDGAFSKRGLKRNDR